MERKARVQRTAEEKWQIVLEGLKSGNIAETCRKYEIAPNLYYRWKDEVEQGAKAALGGKSAASRPGWWPRRWPSAAPASTINEYRSFDHAPRSIALWIEEYNHDRPHRGLRGRTPHESRAAFQATTLTSTTASSV